jgi:hypothetical protein
MATPSLILVPSKYKVGTLYTEVATTSAGTVLGSLGDFSVTRASVATRVNNQGFIETIPAVTNLIVQSQNWLASGWRSDATSNVTTVSATTGTLDPLGTYTANAISPTSGSTSHLKVGSDGTIVFTSGTIYTASAFFKQGTGDAGRYVQITQPIGTFTQGFYANFDLQLGTISATGSVSADTNRAASIENYGNGWYRCRLTATCNAGGSAGSVFALISSSGSTRTLPFSGTTTDILYGWGAQLETGSSTSPYVATTTAAVTNSIPRIDYYTSSGTVGCPALLVEPSGTNLVVQSQNWLASGWRSDAAGATITITGTTGTVDPLGTNTANAISPTSVNTSHLKVGSENSASFTSGTVYTSSAFFKQGTGNAGRYVQLTYPAARFSQEGYANFDLQLGTVAVVSGDVAADTNRAASIENYGNGWYRCRFTATCNVSGTTGNGFTAVLITASGSTRAIPFAGTITDILYGWGAQTETGSVATSYIPTTTGTVTRNADAINVTGAVSGCIGQTEGTIYVEVDARNFTSGARIFAISDGTSDNRVVILFNSSNRIRALISFSVTSQFDVNTSTRPSGIYKIAVAYANNDFAFYVNGVQISTSNAGSAPACSQVFIGKTETTSTTNICNDRIRAAALYTTRLPNEELELLTSPTYYSNVRDLIWGTFVARNSTFSELQSCLQTRHNQLIIV